MEDRTEPHWTNWRDVGWFVVKAITLGLFGTVASQHVEDAQFGVLALIAAIILFLFAGIYLILAVAGCFLAAMRTRR